jgi:phytoene synthase
MPELSEQSLAIIKNGSKSFSLASKLFSPQIAESAALIYHWCRHCDDVIDEGDGSPSLLDGLREKTAAVWNQEATLEELPFQALRLVAQRHQVPSAYAFDLLEGMRMDLEHTKYLTIKDLELYCYRVASTVGLMMSHVMGVYRESALSEAMHLGLAMQMTNICRDVKEDLGRGRVYLPAEILEKHHVDKSNIYADDGKLFAAVSEIISISEKHYDEGHRGIIALPFRPALAVMTALYFYREIGREIIRRGPSALHERTVVSTVKKIYLMGLAIGSVLITLPARLLKPQKTVIIKDVWRYS